MYGSLLLLFTIPRYSSNTYTRLSLINGIYAFLVCFDQMVHMLFVNQLAVVLCFHIVYYKDNTIFKRYTNNKLHFWIGNILNHIAPLVYYGWYIYDKNVQLQDPHIGIVTLMYHLLWKYQVTTSFLLDDIYVRTSPENWYLGWACAVVTHLITPWILQYIQEE